MTPNALAQQAYAQANAPTRTPRKIEYDAIARITFQLKAAAQKGKKEFPALVAAIHENRKLWTLLATMVADPQNELPESLRAQIFYLAEFTRQHSSRVLSGEESVRPLLEVNAAILKGLRGGETPT